jgi:hypothetical protein
MKILFGTWEKDGTTNRFNNTSEWMLENNTFIFFQDQIKDVLLINSKHVMFQITNSICYKNRYALKLLDTHHFRYRI